MSRLVVAIRALCPVVAASWIAACSDPSAPLRAGSPTNALAPKPRGAPGTPVDSSIIQLAAPPLTRFAIEPLDSSRALVAGVPAAMRVRGWDGAGEERAPQVVSWSIDSGAVAQIDSTGKLVADSAGAVHIAATLADTVIRATVFVAAPIVASQSIALTVQRVAPGNGPVLVSTGIPLRPGAVMPTDVDRLRLRVEGVETAAYYEALKSYHPDGSLRAVLVRFMADVPPNKSLVAALDIGVPRAVADLPEPGGVRGAPDAVALPTDPAYLVATDLVGQTVVASDARQVGPIFARYESDFVSFADRAWLLEGARWDANYYDRAYIYDAAWVRTGNPTYFVRGQQLAANYRRDYLEANKYISSPHWAQLEGLAVHYLLTGDDASRKAVVSTAETLAGFMGSKYMSRAMGEGRIAARVLQAQLLAWRLTPGGNTPAGSPVRDWRARTESALAAIYAWQQPDGSFPGDGELCGGQTNFMIGMQNDALIEVYDYFTPATTTQAAMRAQIQDVIAKSADYLWSTQWLPASQSFKYTSVVCAPNSVGEMVGGPTPAPDLNQMIVTTFGWLFRHTGDVTYRTNADAIFAGGVTQAFLSGSKQFNENYATSYRYLGYR